MRGRATTGPVVEACRAPPDHVEATTGHESFARLAVAQVIDIDQAVRDFKGPFAVAVEQYFVIFERGISR